MPEGFFPSPLKNRVPRAKILSPEEKRAISDVRNELRMAYGERQGTDTDRADMARFGEISRSTTATERPRVRRPRLDELSRSYGIQDGPNTRRIARENRQELDSLLNELREDTRRVISNDIADKTANEFHTRIRDRHDNRLADQTAAEFRTRLENRRDAPELSYGDMVDVDIPGDESSPTNARSKPRSRGVYDDDVASYIENLSRTNTPKTPPPIPEAARKQSRNRDRKELDELLAELNADAAPFAARRAAEKQAEQSGRQEVDDLLNEIKQDGFSGAFGARRERENTQARVESAAARSARIERERQESSVILNEDMNRDVQSMRIHDLKANQQAIVEYPRAQVRALQAKTESIASDFEAKTGVPIEAYLAGTLGMADRLRISAQNISSAFGQPFRFVKGMFAGGRPSDEGGKELSPQAIVEQYEHARTQAEEAQAALVSAEVNAQRIQDQIDQLEMTSADYRAKKDADWDRAEHARNLATLGRSSGGAANLFRSDRSQLRADTSVAMETTDPSEWDSSAPRTAHRDLSYNFNPLTASPSLRKLAPLYAKPGPSRTNGIKGYEAYDNVMDIPGFADRYGDLSDEEEIPTRASAISPESAPWSDERPSFVDTLERVGAHMGVDRNTGMAIADTTYELLENDANEERASQADRRFRLLGQYITHINTIEQDLIGERPAEELYRALVRPETHSALRPLIVESLKKLDIQSLPKNDREQMNEVATLLLTALQAKAMTIPPPAQRKNNPPTFVRTADKKLDDDAPEVSLSDEFDPDDFSDILDNLDNKA